MTQSGARLVSLIAPAGYGKSSLAHELRSSYPQSAVVDCASVKDLRDFAQAVGFSLLRNAPGASRREAPLFQLGANEKGARWLEAAIEIWHGECAVVVFENAESLLAQRETVDALARLLSLRPPDRTIVFCSRRAPPFHWSRFFAPHQIISLDAGDLAFSSKEIGRLFEPYGIDGEQLQAIVRFSQGWPIAVLLMRRFAHEKRLAQVLAKVDDSSFELLHDYLVDQILSELSHRQLDVLLTISALPRASSTEISHAVGEDSESLVHDLVARLPFVSADGTHHDVHPLVGSTLRRRFPREIESIVRRAAQTAVVEGRFARGAALFMHVGEQHSAAAALANIPSFLFSDVDFDHAEILLALDYAVVREFVGLRLWLLQLQRGSVPFEYGVRETADLYATLDENAPLELRAAATFQMATAYFNLNQVERCFALLDREVPRLGPLGPAFEANLKTLRASLLAQLGRFSEAQAAWNDLQSASTASRYFKLRAVEHIDAYVALLRGEFDRAFLLLEEITRSFRATGLLLSVLFGLESLVFFAWFAGDDERFIAYLSEWEKSITPSLERGFSFQVQSAKGKRTRGPSGFELPAERVMGYLYACSFFDGEIARQSALSAVAETLCADPLLMLLANVAVSVLLPDKREAASARAAELAGSIESPQLHDAIAAFTRGQTECGILTPFLKRLKKSPPIACSSIYVRVSSASVERDGSSIGLSEREAALVIAIATHRGPISKEQLHELLWPDLAEPAALNNLKVHVHRVRRKMGEAGSIVATPSGYALHPSVQVDLSEMETVLRAARQAAAPIGESTAHALHEWYERFSAGRAPVTQRWEWFDTVEQRITETRREVAIILGQLAFEEKRFAQAQRIARSLIEWDSYDAAGWELSVRAYLANDERVRAIQEYRHYERVLRTELNTVPTASLADLIDAEGAAAAP